MVKSNIEALKSKKQLTRKKVISPFSTQLVVGNRCIHMEMELEEDRLVKVPCDAPTSVGRPNGFLCDKHQAICDRKVRVGEDVKLHLNHEESIIAHDRRIIDKTRNDDNVLSPERLIEVLKLPRHYTIH